MTLSEIKEKFHKNQLSKPGYIDTMHQTHSVLFDYASFILGTNIQKIEIMDHRVIMTSRNHDIKMICDKQDKRSIPLEILNFNEYEKKDFSMLLNLVGSNDVIFDIGANIGWHAINFAKIFPQCTVYSFEPIHKTYSYLNENILLNAVSNVKTYEYGFSNKNEEISFYYYPSGSVNASSAKLVAAQDMEELKCQVRKLDDFIAEEKCQVNLIKCDVEGAELLVFQGGMKTLEQQKPIVFTEMLRKWSEKFNYHPNEIIHLFSQIGYECFFSSNKGRLIKFLSMDENTIETNFFFLHPVWHADKISNFSD